MSSVMCLNLRFCIKNFA